MILLEVIVNDNYSLNCFGLIDEVPLLIESLRTALITRL